MGPETEPPAALAHSAPRLPAVSVYQTSVSRNTQPPLFAICHGGVRGGGGVSMMVVFVFVYVTCVFLYVRTCPSEVMGV